MTTQEQRAEWSALAQAATPGEWAANTVRDTRLDIDVVWVENSMASIVWCGAANRLDVHANAAFIAAARAAVPALLADVDALTAENANAKAALITAAQLMRDANARADALARMLDAEMLRRQDAESDILRLTEDDTQSAFERTAALRAERDALAAELARVRAQLAEVPEPMLYRASTRPLWTDDTPTPGTR